MHSAAVRAFVFDVGDTLWFEAKKPDEETIFALEAERVAPLLRQWRIALDEPLAPILGEIWRAYETANDVERQRGRFRDPSLPFLIRGAMATRGIELSEAQAAQWWREAWISSAEFGLQLYPDTLDVLRELKSAGMMIAVNTNRPCTGEMFMETGAAPLAFARYIDHAVCSGDTGYNKPHPSTFELILERLALPPAAVAMVGDSLENDIAPAKALGMRTVWKLNGRYDLPPSPVADHTVHDLHEILALPVVGGGIEVVAGAESAWPHEDENADRY
jgi:HAD superfamily hydrolase (TIGR01509 family)